MARPPAATTAQLQDQILQLQRDIALLNDRMAENASAAARAENTGGTQDSASALPDAAHLQALLAEAGAFARREPVQAMALAGVAGLVAGLLLRAAR